MLTHLNTLRSEAINGKARVIPGRPKLQELGFDERLAMLADAEANARDNKRLARPLYDAKLRIGNACMEDIDLNPKRDIDPKPKAQHPSLRSDHNATIEAITMTRSGRSR